jgi:DNA-binding MarR family transcriptional regulator
MKQREMEQSVVLYNRGLSLTDASKKGGISRSGLWKWMKAHNVDRRPYGKQFTRGEITELVTMHHKQLMSLRELARHTGLDRQTVTKAIRSSGKMTFSAAALAHAKQRRRDGEFRIQVMELWRAGMRSHAIAKKLHTDTRRIRRIVSGEKEESSTLS